eukprot:6194051-Pleurochrysis_carterae.AAC.4
MADEAELHPDAMHGTPRSRPPERSADAATRSPRHRRCRRSAALEPTLLPVFSDGKRTAALTFNLHPDSIRCASHRSLTQN